MVSQDFAIRRAELKSKITMQSSAVARRRTVLGAAIAAAFTLAVTRATANATTYTVNTLHDTSGNSDCSLRDAINAANGTPTSGSTCATAGSSSNTIQFSVTGMIALGSTLPTVIKTLTITGPVSPGITIDGGDAVRVMQVASGVKLNLKNLTIAHGFSDVKGGGILNDGILTITNSTLSDNITTEPPALDTYFDQNGGGIWNDGTLTVVNSTFSGNEAGGVLPFEYGGGGGIENSGTLTIINSAFSGNSAGSNGGCIENSGPLTITSSTFSGNGVKGDAGCIGNSRTGMITNSTFSGNSSYAGVGGIGNDGTLTVINSTFSRNGEGDGAILNGGTLTVINSTFSGNEAGGSGSIDNYGTSNITNCTFSGNLSGDGAIGNSGTLTVTNSTFSSNSSEFSGGDIDNFSFPGVIGSARLKNTILAGSTNPFGAPISNCGGSITDAGYNISDDDSCRFSATGSRNSTNPLLSTAGLANNGGPTQTIALDSESPAIDAIPLANCTDQASKRIITDQRGALRPDAGEVKCDIGSYEFQDFAGQPLCGVKSVVALIRQFGSVEAAASALGFPSVIALLKAIAISCGG